MGRDKRSTDWTRGREVQEMVQMKTTKRKEGRGEMLTEEQAIHTPQSEAESLEHTPTGNGGKIKDQQQLKRM